MEILNQSGTRERLESLINQAEKYIILVSPYVTLDKLRSLVRPLQVALANDVQVKLVFRKRDVSSGGNDVLASETIGQLREAGMELRVLKDLHAKIYLSEKGAILTSLNLLESSFNNSIEIGTWFAASNPAYQKVVEFLKREIHPTSELISSLPEPEAPATKKQRRKRESVKAELPSREAANEGSENDGSCIGCATGIEFNPERPLCSDCYKAWKKNKDPEWQGEFCQLCGTDSEKISFSKPLCRDCYKDIAR